MKYVLIFLILSIVGCTSSGGGGGFRPEMSKATVEEILLPIDLCGNVREYTMRTMVILDPWQDIEILTSAFRAEKKDPYRGPFEEPLDMFSYELVDAGNSVVPLGTHSDSTRTWKRLYVTISHKISCDLLDRRVFLEYQVSSEDSVAADSTEKDWNWPQK